MRPRPREVAGGSPTLGPRPLLRLDQGIFISRGRVETFVLVFVFFVKCSRISPAAAALGGGLGWDRFCWSLP